MGSSRAIIFAASPDAVVFSGAYPKHKKCLKIPGGKDAHTSEKLYKCHITLLFLKHNLWRPQPSHGLNLGVEAEWQSFYLNASWL